MHVAVTGASGFLGSALVPHLLDAGHDVTRFVRGAAAGPGEALWDPAGERLDHAVLRSADAVVHLAGESFEGRWDDAKCRRIRRSRVDGARLIADRLAGLADHRPRVLVVASAIGFYGDRGDEELTEGSPRGSGFLADVCDAVEAAAGTASGTGVRVACIRIGIVQSPDGGMLAAQLPLFRRGLGARLGLGRRHLSWIALPDLVRVFEYALRCPDVAGPVNAVAPGAVTNAEYTRILARVVGRPSILAIPPALPRLALGRFADEVLLQSARVRPAVLAAHGFDFRYGRLEEALRDLVPQPE
jgi:uncharacterized protein (TIGR01777 family)